MVFFICSGCGEALKKNRVGGHFWCHGFFSCMDCHEEFDGRSFQYHTKCISEAQKYGGKHFVQKENKGEAKQNAWRLLVTRAIDSVLVTFVGQEKTSFTCSSQSDKIQFIKPADRPEALRRGPDGSLHNRSSTWSRSDDAANQISSFVDTSPPSESVFLQQTLDPLDNEEHGKLATIVGR